MAPSYLLHPHPLFYSCLCGIEPVDSGEITVAGRALTALEKAALDELRRGSIGYVFQAFHLLPTLTAAENIEMAAQLAGLPRQVRHDRVAALLKEPTEDMHLEAHAAADHQTYTNTMEGFWGGLGQGAQRARTAVPPLGVLLPFVRTPSRVPLIELAWAPSIRVS